MSKAKLSIALTTTIHEVAGLNPQMRNIEELRKYLLDQGFSSNIIETQRDQIWRSYQAKVYQPSNSSNRLTSSGGPTVLPPSPSSMRSGNKYAESTTSSVFVEGDIDILRGNGSITKGGCIIDENVEESLISDESVEGWGLEIVEGQTLLVPSQDIPEHDVKFGRGYKNSKGNKTRDRFNNSPLEKEPINQGRRRLSDQSTSEPFCINPNKDELLRSVARMNMHSAIELENKR